jgi:hypothetical protein
MIPAVQIMETSKNTLLCHLLELLRVHLDSLNTARVVEPEANLPMALYLKELLLILELEVIQIYLILLCYRHITLLSKLPRTLYLL